MLKQVLLLNYVQEINATQDPIRILQLMKLITDDEHWEELEFLKGKLHDKFSKWSWAHVSKKFSLSADKLPSWEPPKCLVPDSIIAWIVDAYKMLEFSHGSINSGKEIRRNLYIQMLLSRLVSMFGGKISIENEGCMEFVLYIFKTALSIIIQAKTDVIEKDKGQLFLKLYVTEKMNSITGFERPLYGAVSTGAVWYFYRYTRVEVNVEEDAEDDTDCGESESDGGGEQKQRKKRRKDEGEDGEGEDEDEDLLCYTFEESRPYICSTEKGIKEVSAIVYWLLLQGWCDAQAELMAVSFTSHYFCAYIDLLKKSDAKFKERSANKGKKHSNKRKKFNLAKHALAIAKKRYESATIALNSALVATDNASAQSALDILTNTFSDESDFLFF